MPCEIVAVEVASDEVGELDAAVLDRDVKPSRLRAACSRLTPSTGRADVGERHHGEHDVGPTIAGASAPGALAGTRVDVPAPRCTSVH